MHVLTRNTHRGPYPSSVQAHVSQLGSGARRRQAAPPHPEPFYPQIRCRRAPGSSRRASRDRRQSPTVLASASPPSCARLCPKSRTSRRSSFALEPDGPRYREPGGRDPDIPYPRHADPLRRQQRDSCPRRSRLCLPPRGSAGGGADDRRSAPHPVGRLEHRPRRRRRGHVRSPVSCSPTRCVPT